MKFSNLLSLALISLGMDTFAAVPNCWNYKNVKEWSYIVYFQTEGLSKEDIIKVLVLSDNKINLVSPAYPTISLKKNGKDASVMINAEAADFNIGANKLTKKQLQAEVEKQLEKVADVKGVKIYCNAIAHPTKP